MKQLIAALESATGSSDGLDGDIWEALGLHPDFAGYKRIPETGIWRDDERGYSEEAPRYTRSIDAARWLIPRGHDWLTGTGESWVWPKPGMSKGHRAGGATIAISLCIAALKAREAEQ